VPVEIQYYRSDVKGALTLSSEWHVLPSDELIYSLYDGFGLKNVRLSYGD